MRRVRDRGQELGQETLVYLVRVGLRSGNHDLLDAAATKMLPRLEPIAKKSAAGWLDWEEVYREALSVMWRDVYQKREAPLIFWEERCYFAFKRKCLQVLGKMQRQAEADVEGLEAVRSEALTESSIEDSVRALNPRAIVVVLRALSARQRRAVFLAWYRNLPVSGGEGSVSQTMGVSASMVHRYLRETKALVAELRETDPELRGLLGLEE